MKITMLPEGYTSSVMVHQDFEDAEAFLDTIATTHNLATSKDTAPCILPCSLRSLTDGKLTKSGRRRVTDAHDASVVILDIDHGDLDQHDLEGALDVLGVVAVYYSTWRAGDAHGMRWRVLIPLARPIPAPAYRHLFQTVARSLEHTLLREHPRPPKGWVDWSGKTVTQPALLPTSGTRPATEWGGRHPNPIVVEGTLLDPGELPDIPRPRNPRTSSHLLRERTPKPYVPTVSPEGQAAYIEMGQGKVPAILASLDATLVARREGLPGRKGRHATLSGACFALHRAGFPEEEVTQLIEDTLDATHLGPRVMERLRHDAERLDIYWLNRAEADDAVVPVLVQTVRDHAVVPDTHVEALEHYCRILARHRHLRRKGGKVDHGAVAKIVGLSVKVVSAWMIALETGGLLWRTGQARGRTYGLHVAEATHQSDEELELMLAELLPAEAM